jgi:hypothetical protein
VAGGAEAWSWSLGAAGSAGVGFAGPGPVDGDATFCFELSMGLSQKLKEKTFPRNLALI